jgi:hypothetical protein
VKEVALHMFASVPGVFGNQGMIRQLFTNKLSINSVVALNQKKYISVYNSLIGFIPNKLDFCTGIDPCENVLCLLNALDILLCLFNALDIRGEK